MTFIKCKQFAGAFSCVLTRCHIRPRSERPNKFTQRSDCAMLGELQELHLRCYRAQLACSQQYN